MTVQELIDALQKLPTKDNEVQIYVSDQIGYCVVRGAEEFSTYTLLYFDAEVPTGEGKEEPDDR